MIGLVHRVRRVCRSRSRRRLATQVTVTQHRRRNGNLPPSNLPVKSSTNLRLYTPPAPTSDWVFSPDLAFSVPVGFQLEGASLSALAQLPPAPTPAAAPARHSDLPLLAALRDCIAHDHANPLLPALYPDGEHSLLGPLALSSLIPLAIVQLLGLDRPATLLPNSQASPLTASAAVARFLRATTRAGLLSDEAMVAALVLVSRTAQRTGAVAVSLESLPLVYAAACSLATKSLRDQSRQQTVVRTTQFAAAALGSTPDAVAEFCECEFAIFLGGLDCNAHVSSAALLEMLAGILDVCAAGLVPAHVLEAMVEAFLAECLHAHDTAEALSPSSMDME
eukprot:TRINITY_DN563_c0_g2_i3.p1 TRINITY_DN563_c0_g2~~TRINITY_DN563_c0_g2_i3.p1  ORF type:complete len:379 (+),score=94.43 TRINITY_DN563_c0_g2_i3:130-1137(+)